MEILTDIHTHTLVSDHAYSTLIENAAAAAERGLSLIAMTNHGPSMEDAPHIWHFVNLKVIPPKIGGVKVLCGAEANVINPEGELDIPNDILSELGIVIASLHNLTYKPSDSGDCTETWLNVLKNPYVDVLGHTGRGNFPFDYDTVVKEARDRDVCIEVNRHTITNERQRGVCREIILSCKKFGTKIVVNSDAHFCSQIGDFADAKEFLSEIDFPAELIVNRDEKSLLNHLKNKNKHFDYN